MSSDPAPNSPVRTGLKPAPRPPQSQTARLMMWILLAAVIGPCAVLEGPSEVARWLLAAGTVDREAGQSELAYDRLERALAWTTDNADVYLQRARWRVEDRDYAAALADCNQAHAAVGDDNAAVLMFRSQVYQHLGRHEEAIADLKTVDQLSQTTGTPTRDTALNGLAYARAVGNLQLDEGLTGVNEALRFRPADPMILDTRGFLLYRLDKYADALADMNLAVAGLEKDVSKLEKQIKTGQVAGDEDSQKTILKQYHQPLAVVLYHRALVLEKLDRADDAKKDLARAKELIGREPDETLF